MRAFRSKYPGTCANCREGYAIDDYIAYVSTKEVYHFDCRPTAGEQDPDKFVQDGYLFTDTETGGTEKQSCALIQVAVIVTDNNFLIKDFWDGLICPPKNLVITERATEIHGWTREMLANERPEAEVIEEYLGFCRQFPNHRIAGQNVSYDLGMLEAAYERNRISAAGAYLQPAYDTLDIARRKLQKKTANHKLGTLAAYFGFNADAAHDALCDLFLNVQVARQLEVVAV
ncbi:MAG TPA: 3'-5' exonuclease [Drouetiella sp.]